MFKILGQDKKEYGPVSADVVRQWIAERRANAQTLVQPEGGTEFRPLGEFPEFQEALAAPASGVFPAVRPAGVAQVSMSAEPPAKGLAVTSMVLGFFSCLFFPAIGAIITGHIALSRSRREPARYRGRGMAIAGLVMGYAAVALVPVLAVLAGFWLPNLAKAKAKAHRINCISNLKQIGLAARMYSNDNKEIFPPNFLIMSNELASPRILVCPADSGHTKAVSWSDFSEAENVTYEYLRPGAKEQDVMNETVFRCPIHNNVALGDGSAQQLQGGQWR